MLPVTWERCGVTMANDHCDNVWKTSRESRSKIVAFPTRRQRSSCVNEAKSEAPSVPVGSATSLGMFSIDVRKDLAGHVLVFGRPTRKRAGTCLRVPLCQADRRRLEKRVAGSLAMGVSALLEWALDELGRQGVTIEAQLTDAAPPACR